MCLFSQRNGSPFNPSLLPSCSLLVFLLPCHLLFISVKVLKRGLETRSCVSNHFPQVDDNAEEEGAQSELLNEPSSK